MKLWRKFNCLIGNHEWTSKDEQGIKIDYDEIMNHKDPEKAFRDYAAIFCVHCGKVIK